MGCVGKLSLQALLHAARYKKAYPTSAPFAQFCFLIPGFLFPVELSENLREIKLVLVNFW